eukprot:m.72619 g.72619  ORF g.72619 m.72619 type:complete len:448 (+) comp14260_c0_seq1:248-1591(+)
MAAVSGSDEAAAGTGLVGSLPAPAAPWMSWSRTSSAVLAHFESLMLAGVSSPIRVAHVPVRVVLDTSGGGGGASDPGHGSFNSNTGGGDGPTSTPVVVARSQCFQGGEQQQAREHALEINTLMPIEHGDADAMAADPRPPLVLLHGFGGGIGLWSLNIDELSKQYRVYAIDLLGFGRSSRPKIAHLPKSVAESEDLVVETLEAWRKAVGLDRFYLAGHSFGGYQAGLYALRHPHRVSHLIFVDPWGFPRQPLEDLDARSTRPLWVRSLLFVLQRLNHPLTALRIAGPFGRSLLERARPDIALKYASLAEPDTVYKYIFHLNAQAPAGEAIFATFNTGMAWAKRPFIERVQDLHPELPCTFIYGERTWMDRSMADVTQELRCGMAPVFSFVVPNAGHQVFAENHTGFNTHLTAVRDLPTADIAAPTKSGCGQSQASPARPAEASCCAH